MKQGGCLSPMLFTVYFDGLIEGWKGVLLVGDIVVYLVGQMTWHLYLPQFMVLKK